VGSLLAAMPSSPPQEASGDFPVGDMVLLGLLALLLVVPVVGWVASKVEQLLVRLKL